MKKTFPLLALMATLSLSAQNHRFAYEFSFKSDSLNRDNITKEIMYLDVAKDGSNFYSKYKFESDSLRTAAFAKAAATRSTDIKVNIDTRSKVGFSVTKQYPKLESVLHTSISGDRYAVAETEKLNWIIQPEKQEIAGYKVQKATANFLGRNWIAWFTGDIQIQDGPYKFAGLPGLILQIEDTKGDHVFNFIGSKKLVSNPAIQNATNNKELLISAKQFNKLWKEYLNDPGKKIRQMFSDPMLISVKAVDSNGKSMNQDEIIRMREKDLKEKLSKSNNYLDLNLYK